MITPQEIEENIEPALDILRSYGFRIRTLQFNDGTPRNMVTSTWYYPSKGEFADWTADDWKHSKIDRYMKERSAEHTLIVWEFDRVTTITYLPNKG